MSIPRGVLAHLVLAGVLGWFLVTHLQPTPTGTISALEVARVRVILEGGAGGLAAAGKLGFTHGCLSALGAWTARALGISPAPSAIPCAVSWAAAMAALLALTRLLPVLAPGLGLRLLALAALACTPALVALGTGPGPGSVVFLLCVLALLGCRRAMAARHSPGGDLVGLILFSLVLEGPVFLLLLPLWVTTLVRRARSFGPRAIAPALLLLALPLALLATIAPQVLTTAGAWTFAGWAELGRRTLACLPLWWWPALIFGLLAGWRQGGCDWGFTLWAGVLLWAACSPVWAQRFSAFALLASCGLLAAGLMSFERWRPALHLGWICGVLLIVLVWPSCARMAGILHERRHVLAELTAWVASQRCEGDLFVALRGQVEVAFLRAYGWPQEDIRVVPPGAGAAEIEAVSTQREARMRRVLLILGPHSRELRRTLLARHRLRLLRDVDPCAARNLFDLEGGSLNPLLITRMAPIKLYTLELAGP